jgi:hypothetical protein
MTTRPALGTIFGAVAAVIGAFVVWAMLLGPLFDHLLQGAAPEEYLVLVMMLFLCLPGVLAVYFGLRLIFQKQPRYYRATVITLAVYGWGFLQYLLSEYAFQNLPQLMAC